MDEVEEQLVKVINTCLTDRDVVKSITGFKWILEAI
jgi:hypothetical protein